MIQFDELPVRGSAEQIKIFRKAWFVDREDKCAVSGKRKYASEGEALATAAHQIANTGAPKDLRAYLCSWCEAWHLTKGAAKGGKGRK
jgi:hypothetical protein